MTLKVFSNLNCLSILALEQQKSPTLIFMNHFSNTSLTPPQEVTAAEVPPTRDVRLWVHPTREVCNQSSPSFSKKLIYSIYSSCLPLCSIHLEKVISERTVAPITTCFPICSRVILRLKQMAKL